MWRHLRLTVPDEWELLRYARDPKAGRCLFADRYEYRLELDWKRVPGPPDFGRMSSDYAAALKRDERMTSVEPVRRGRWTGLVVRNRVDGCIISRFGTHLPEEGLLVELVFIWPSARDEALEGRVLDSVREVPAGADGRRRWRVFGMDMQVDAGLDLNECSVLPGRAVLGFRTPAGKPFREQRFERYGMTETWLHRPVPEWLRLRIPHGIAVQEERNEAAGGHEVAVCRGDRPAHGWRRWLGRRLSFETRAWICPRDGRLYCATRTGVEAAALPDLACADWKGGAA